MYSALQTLTIKTIFLVLLSCICLTSVFGQEEADSIQTIDQLRSAIEQVLEETGTPGVGLAIVDQNGPIWIAGLGKAKVEEDINASKQTMFRIGSITKMFASLSILKLQEEGKVQLTDRVSDLVPEIAFENQWEDTDPVRVAHLLEHTTGWDDLHLPEYAHSEPDPVTTKEGLDFHPHSRISRWVPGSRMSYCNSGPPVAAYIVEKITGQPFEEYVNQAFFEPMGMETMTYFLSDDYLDLGASLYQGQEPQPYWHIIQRPSGSINASAIDMAKMVGLFVHRGMVDSVRLISDASLKRMETPGTTTAARVGMISGYGLSNYSIEHGPFVFRGHNGGVNGGLAELGYLPADSIGYAFMINSGSGDALHRIGSLVKDFVTRNLPEPEPLSATIAMTDAIKDNFEGYYIPINPRQEFGRYAERILGIRNLWSDEETLSTRGVIFVGNKVDYLPISSTMLAAKASGLSHVALVEDPLDGQVLHMGTRVFKPISLLGVIVQSGFFIGWIVLSLLSLVYSLVWGIQYFTGKLEKGPELQLRAWNFRTIIALFASVILIIMGMAEAFERLASPTLTSIGIMGMTLVYSAVVTWAFIHVIVVRNMVNNRVLYWIAVVSAVVHFVVVGYLTWYGIIGIRTWA